MSSKGRTELQISLPRAKNVEEAAGDICFCVFPQKTSENAEKKNVKKNQKFPKVSERIQMHPNASERIRMYPNRSEQLRKPPKTCENLEKLAKTSKKHPKFSN